MFYPGRIRGMRVFRIGLAGNQFFFFLLFFSAAGLMGLNGGEAPAGRTDSSGAGEQALRKVVLQLKWTHQFQFAGYYMAREKGFFRNEGLSVEIREGGSEISVPQQLRNGRADFGIINSEVVLLHAQGAPLTVLAAVTQHSTAVLGYVDLEAIRTPQDLAGRRVSLGRGSRDAELLAMLAEAGVYIPDYQRVPYTGTVDPLIRGETDAASMYLSNEIYQLEKRGIPYRYFEPRDYGIDFYGDCLAVRRDLAEENPDLARAFRDASLRGWQYAFSHVEETLGVVQDVYGSAKSQGELRHEAQILRQRSRPDGGRLGHMDPMRWREILETYYQLGFIAERPEVSLRESGFYLSGSAGENRGTGVRLLLILLAAGGGLFLGGSFLYFRLRRLVARQTAELRRTNQRLQETNHALEEARERAEEGSRAKSLFLANMSHEIRTPLHGMKSMIALLESEGGLPPEKQSYLNFTKISLERLSLLVDDILDISRIEFGKMGLNIRSFDLRSTVQAVEELQRRQAEDKGLSLDVSYDLEDPSPGELLGDSLRIQQILENLLSNAVKYTESGGVELLVRWTWRNSGEGTLLLRVRDTGIGISREDQKKIYYDFQQLENPYSKQHSGVGLGLSIVNQLVNLMKGRIDLTSRPGEGSCFSVFIPLVSGNDGGGDPSRQPSQPGHPGHPGDAPKAEPDRKKAAPPGTPPPGTPPPETPSSGTPSSGTPSPGTPSPETVLVAEDEAINRMSLGIMLRREGLAVDEVSNGKEAVEALKDGSYSVVLMDISMPVMSGVEALRAIRQGESGSDGDGHQRVLALTAHAHESDVRNFLSEGFDGVIIKPYTLEQLREALGLSEKD